MSVITLTGHLGSMGSIAVRVAQSMEFDLADRELMMEAAAALGWSEEDVEAFDERTSGLGGRLTRLLRGFIERAGRANVDPMMTSVGLEAVLGRTYGDTAGPEMQADEERYIDTLSELILAFAARGNIVIVGRGAQALLQDREDTLHIRVACPQAERIDRIVARDEMSLEDATARVKDSDQQREAWHAKYFEIDYREPYHYHLVVNSGRLSDPLAAQLIVEAARRREPRPG
jgi:cytidylate kinase